MSLLEEQYTESLKMNQQAVLDAFEAWTKSAQIAFNTPSTNLTVELRPDQVIDQVFDFAEQMLGVQRQFAKRLAAAATTNQRAW